MDAMDEATLYEAAEQMRKAGKLRTKQVERCNHAKRRCRLVGTYEAANGRLVHIAGPIKLSPAKSEELGVPRRIPGRAWLDGEERTVLVGCNHDLRTVTLR